MQRKSATVRDLMQYSVGTSRQEFIQEMRNHQDATNQPPPNKDKGTAIEKYKLKPNDMNTLLRTGFDPELMQMIKEYDILRFDEEAHKKSRGKN